MYYIILIILIVISIYYLKYYKDNNYNLISQISDIDNNIYLVADVINKRTAANTLAKIKKNVNKLTDYLYSNITNFKEYEDYIIQLKNGVKNTKFLEGLSGINKTSYTINKGEEMVLCIRNRNKEFHELNLLMYVVIHEMAHIACPEQGHTKLFSKIFAFLLSVAIDINIYRRIDFYNFPQDYCGMTITDSIV